MNASHFSPDTWAFIQLLGRYRVAYVVVGGEAVIHYGYVRLTGDLDFEEAWRSRETLVADDGTPVHLISLALLIQNK